MFPLNSKLLVSHFIISVKYECTELPAEETVNFGLIRLHTEYIKLITFATLRSGAEANFWILTAFLAI